MWSEMFLPDYHLFVLSSPSGGGKTTIIKRILALRPQIKYSISATTRPRSETERDGTAYFFLTPSRFQEMIEKGELIEYEEVHNNYYGTPKSFVEQAITENRPLIFDLDVKGGLHLKKIFPRAVLIFIMPPSLEELKERLKNRHRESPEAIKFRLQRVDSEIKAGAKYDHIVINDNLEEAVQEVLEIIDREMSLVISQ
jgi:guanylate kinase